MIFPALTKGTLFRRYKRFLADYDTISAEVKFDPETRLDFYVTGPGQPLVSIEVKNCSLVENGVAAFPDAVTVRGHKHLRALWPRKKRAENWA